MRVTWASSWSRARTSGADAANGAFKSWLQCDEPCVMDSVTRSHANKQSRLPGFLKASQLHQRLSTRNSRHPHSHSIVESTPAQYLQHEVSTIEQALESPSCLVEIWRSVGGDSGVCRMGRKMGSCAGSLMSSAQRSLAMQLVSRALELSRFRLNTLPAPWSLHFPLLVTKKCSWKLPRSRGHSRFSLGTTAN